MRNLQHSSGPESFLADPSWSMRATRKVVRCSHRDQICCRLRTSEGSSVHTVQSSASLCFLWSSSCTCKYTNIQARRGRQDPYSSRKLRSIAFRKSQIVLSGSLDARCRTWPRGISYQTRASFQRVGNPLLLQSLTQQRIVACQKEGLLTALLGLAKCMYHHYLR